MCSTCTFGACGRRWTILFPSGSFRPSVESAMSSNSASKRSASLATRLSWWYALSSFFLVLIVTGLLYLALVHNFDQQNERYLAEKAAILRTLLEDAKRRNATVNGEVEEELPAQPS